MQQIFMKEIIHNLFHLIFFMQLHHYFTKQTN